MKVNSWTVLCFFDGHGDMQSDVDRSVRQLESVGSTDSVELVAQVACGEPYYGSYTSHLQKSRLLGFLPTSQSMAGPSSSDPADPDCLTESIVNTTKAFPSEHVMVVVHGHGGAFKGLLPNTQTREKMSLQGLKTAVDAAAAALGRPIDMLVLDSCLMGCVETAYALKDSVRYLAVSEEVVPGNNMRYDVLARELQGADLDQAADACMKARDNGRLATASIIDCSKIDELVERMRPFARSVDTNTFGDVQHFRQPAVLKRLSNSGSETSPMNDMRDLATLAEHAGDAELARFVSEEVVVRNAHGRRQGLDQAQGLAIYAPTGEPVEDYQADLFAQATGWLTA